MIRTANARSVNSESSHSAGWGDKTSNAILLRDVKLGWWDRPDLLRDWGATDQGSLCSWWGKGEYYLNAKYSLRLPVQQEDRGKHDQTSRGSKERWWRLLGQRMAVIDVVDAIVDAINMGWCKKSCMWLCT
eukprot:3513792-Rhodomonas_salina.1